jgi:probable rRNA maturation factor
VSVELDVQYALQGEGIPPASAFRIWSEAALADREGDAQLVIRVVDEAESRALNHAYRGKDRPTNVLSFPFQAPQGVPAEEVGDYLGDLVICAPVVEREADEQGKPLAAHWAHMVVHGVLHLRGYDHQDDAQARAMEDRERGILDGLGISDPYAESR